MLSKQDIVGIHAVNEVVYQEACQNLQQEYLVIM